MQRLEDKLTDIYVDRTNADRDTIVALMKDGKFISADKAQEIGLISTIIAPASAKHTPINNHIKRESDMDNETIKVHPTQKSIHVLKYLIELFTDKGDVGDIFTDTVIWLDIMKIIKSINANAKAA